MEQQLKQRLIGVTIVVALVVIFVPMLFDQSDDKGKFSAIGIPAIPDDVMEKTIELPKTAEDLAPKESEGEGGGESEGKPAESGYRIVPLNNEPPPAKPKPTDRLAAQPKTPVEEDMGEKPLDAEGVDIPKPLESGAKENKATHPARVNVLKSPVVDKPSVSLKPGVDTQQPTTPTPRKARHGTPKHTPIDTEPNAHGDAQDAQVTSPVKIDNPASKKLNAQTGMEARHTEAVPRKEAASKKLETIKSAHPLVKASKPKTSTPSPAEADRDLEEDDIPAPVKPEIPQAKPKPVAGNPLPSKASAGKSTTSPKPSVTEHPTAKTTKPEPSTVDAVTPPPAKPKVVKPAPTPAEADPQPVAKPKAVKPAPSADADTPPTAKPKAVKPAPSTAEDTPPAKPKAVKPTPVPAPTTAKPVKPPDAEKPKPQTMAPSEWPVLARCETDTVLPQAFSARIDMRGS